MHLYGFKQKIYKEFQQIVCIQCIPFNEILNLYANILLDRHACV